MMAAVKLDMGPIATYGPGLLMRGEVREIPPAAQGSVRFVELLIVVWVWLTIMLRYEDLSREYASKGLGTRWSVRKQQLLLSLWQCLSTTIDGEHYLT